MSFKVLASKAAALLDKELMSTSGFTLDQLMELAGLSVAQAIYKEYPPSSDSKVLLICGPGNNGGDGLVASRHLKLFGYHPIVYYPKQNTKLAFFQNLHTQLKTFEINVITDELSSKELDSLIQANDIIVDSMFGFSFKPPMREPFASIVKQLVSSDKKIVSVDIPTGWDVDQGPIGEDFLQPSLLVSLTSPKPCSLKGNKFVHYLGGRFVDEKIGARWGFDVPQYPGVDQVVKLN